MLTFDLAGNQDNSLRSTLGPANCHEVSGGYDSLALASNSNLLPENLEEEAGTAATEP